MKLLPILFVTLSISPSLSGQDVAPPGDLAATSSNFLIQSYRGGPDSEKVVILCELLRRELRRVWGEEASSEKWAPRCEIIIHGTRDTYHNAVGQGSGQTDGSSLIDLQAGAITRRRIDLLVVNEGALKALPHELSHVVLADYFGAQQPPRWLDEGIATLVDTREKQLLHERDCMEIVADGTALTLVELMQLEQLTSPEQFAAFYGQSLTLVQMLIEQERPKTLIEFALKSREIGVEPALRDHYGIADIRELERRWKMKMTSWNISRSRTPIIAVPFHP